MAESPSVYRVWYGFISGTVVAGVILSLARFHKFLLPPPPSYSIAVLGVLAVVMTLLLPKEPSRSTKAAWMLAAFAVMFLEMWAITHDHNEQEKRHLAELGTQQSQFQSSIEHFSTIESDVSGIQKINTELAQLKSNPFGHPSQPKVFDQPTLKQRALEMAKRILEWVSLRQQTVAERPQPVFGIPNTQAIDQRNREIVEYEQQHAKFESGLGAEWKTRFFSEVTEITDQLKVREAMASTSDSCQVEVTSNNLFMRRNCAKGIEEAALKLK